MENSTLNEGLKVDFVSDNFQLCDYKGVPKVYVI